MLFRKQLKMADERSIEPIFQLSLLKYEKKVYQTEIMRIYLTRSQDKIIELK